MLYNGKKIDKRAINILTKDRREKKMDKELKDKIEKIQEIVQLDVEHDNELFIDPYRIDEKRSELLKRAKEKILKYFDLFFYSVEHNLRDNAAKIGEHLHEINATKLGYSSKGDRPKGKGFCQRDLLLHHLLLWRSVLQRIRCFLFLKNIKS